MTLETFLNVITQGLFLFAALSTTFNWLRQRDQTRLDIALVFILLAISIIADNVQKLFGFQNPLLSLVQFVAFLAQPYFLLRAARYFRPLHPLIRQVALIGLLASYALLLLAVFVPIPAVTITVVIVILVYFVVFEGYATYFLVRGAQTIPGLTGKRLRLVAVGAGTFAFVFLAALLLPGINFLAPLPTGVLSTVGVLLQLIGIVSSLTYYLGFVPPRWLRRTWQLSELQTFLRQTSEQVAHNQTQTLEQLSVAAIRTVGGSIVAVACWDAAAQHLKVELSGDPPLQAETLDKEETVIGRAWRQRQAQVAHVPHDLGLETVDWADQIGAKALFIVPITSPLRPWGLLIVALKYAPLFAEDDLESLRLLADQSATALDYSALIAELRVSNQSLEQHVAERTAELSKVNRALRTISDCNQELVRADSEEVLLSRICNIIVSTGGYQMAWVGYKEYDEAQSIRPAQWSGVDDAFFESFDLSWADAERGRIPMATTIRTGQPTVVHIGANETYGPWRDAVLQRGYAACIALPLMNDEQAFGGLGIFTNDPLAFDEAEVKLLIELANDLAFGIIALRTQAARGKAEDALQRSEDFLIRTNQMAKVGGWELDLTTMKPYWSEETYRIHDVEPSLQPDLENAINFYAPEGRPVITAAIEKIMADGTPYDLELPFITATGKHRWVRTQGQAEFQDGKCVRLSGTFQDITELRRAEEKLRQSQVQLSGIISSAMDGIITVDADQRIIVFNAAAEAIFRCSSADALGQPLDRFIPERFRGTHADHIRRFGQTGVTNRAMGKLNSLSALRADGSEFPIEASISQITVNDQPLYTVILRDITERKRVEDALLKSEERFSKAFRVSPAALSISRLADGLFVDINDSFLRMYGYTREEVIGRTSTDLQMMPSSEERAALTQQLRQHGTIHNYELTSRNKSGQTLIVLFSTELIELHNESHILAILFDITDRKRAEAQLHETMLKLERNNRELQDFAYVASHDLQEPLRKIRAFGDRLQARAGSGLDETGRDYLKRMQVAATRMQTLIEDLLTFSRVTTKAQPFTQADLNPIVRDVLTDLEIRVEQTGAQVEVGQLPSLDADPVQMRQVLQNLIGNALKFHKPETKPVVKIWGEANNGQCHLYVSDNGIGFDEKYLDRIFTPFQRLHGRGEYEGTGIGLAVVRKIVERHSGDVTANSRPGEGATFIVTLPVHQVKES